MGMSYFSNMSASWHGASTSEYTGPDKLFKSAGRENCFEVEKYGQKNSKTHLQLNHTKLNHTYLIYANLISADSTNIEPKNQHDLADSHLLQKFMSWL